MVTHVVNSFLHIFLWERFRSIAPRIVDFDQVTFSDVMVEGIKKRKKIHSFMPKAWRWSEIE